MKNFKTVSPCALHDMIELGEQVHLVDVRTPAEYRAGHQTPLFLTCQSGIRSEQAAERLMQAGIENLYLIDGGADAWSRAGLPMQRCGHAISLERQVQISIGAGLIVAGLTQWCGMARLIANMPWNRASDCAKQVAV